MNKFIHRENLALFRRRLADPDLPVAQRKIILKLLTEEEVKVRQPTPPAQDHEP